MPVSVLHCFSGLLNYSLVILISTSAYTCNAAVMFDEESQYKEQVGWP